MTKQKQGSMLGRSVRSRKSVNYSEAIV